MLRELDRTISELVRGELDERGMTSVGISFAAPDDQFPPMGVSLPAVSFFLYDVRENTDLRVGHRDVEREGGQSVRRRRPVHVECSYLITAWPGEATDDRPGDEHLLLGEVMRVLLRHRTIPEVQLPDGLAATQPPLRTRVLAASQLQSMGEFWQAMGGKPKAALHYAVTLSVDVHEPEVVPVAEHFRFDLHERGVSPAAAERFGFDPRPADPPSDN